MLNPKNNNALICFKNGNTIEVSKEIALAVTKTLMEMKPSDVCISHLKYGEKDILTIDLLQVIYVKYK